MEKIARFATPTEAQEALDALKARGIDAAIVPDEVRRQVGFALFDIENINYLVGYKLEVEEDRSHEARRSLKDLGFVVFDDEDE